jgi:hypothetical protein
MAYCVRGRLSILRGGRGGQEVARDAFEGRFAQKAENAWVRAV